jgi:molybdopterin-guanine dinucleotide biosynthesis protein A
MGTAKALVEVDGVPLAQRAARALLAGGATVLVAVGSVPEVAVGLELDVVPDGRAGEGPLAALADALGWAAGPGGGDVLVVAACDQPDLTAALVDDLVHALVHAPPELAGAVPQTPDGRAHPFPSAWRVAAAEGVEALVAGGARRMSAAFDLGVVRVPAGADELLDLDTRADLTTRRDRGRRPAP